MIALPGIAYAFDPYGTWMRPSTGTQVSFYDCGGKLCAKIVAVKDERRKSEIGTVIITGATKSTDNQWKGDLLNADDGKIYAGVVTMQGRNALNLKAASRSFARERPGRRLNDTRISVHLAGG
ncbi:MAG: DUF2147 domain-containing protein [Xanthobacteraceae bacterium]